GLSTAGGLQAEHARALRRNHERVGHSARRDRDAAGSDSILLTLQVQEDLAVQHVDRLVRLGMRMQRGHLASRHHVLEQQERATGLAAARLPRVDAAAVEPQPLTLSLDSNDWNRRARRHYSPPEFMELKSHEETKVPYRGCQPRTRSEGGRGRSCGRGRPWS